ncbi:MAG: hypothetical protein WBW04_17410 [Nitrolancea sp.]
MSASSSQERADRIGEVIETSTIRIWAECDQLNCLPRLGSVIKVATFDGEAILAVVSYGETVGIDSTRRAVRRGSADVQDEDVYKRHPELARVLRSTFEALPVAVHRAGQLYYIAPPVPPPLHYSVEATSVTLLGELTDRLDYLPALTRSTGPVPAEQIVIAHIREAFAERGHDLAWLERAAAELGRIYARDYDLLLPILQAIDPGTGAATTGRTIV